MGERNTSEPKAKRGRGRPTKRTAVDFAHANQLAAEGLTIPEIARALEIGQSTIYRWMAENKHFRESIHAGRKVADGEVERSLLDRARGYEHPEEKIFCVDGEIIRAETTKRYPPDTMAAIWWLKNRQPDKWKDKQEIEHSGAVDLFGGLAAARQRLAAVETAECEE